MPDSLSSPALDPQSVTVRLGTTYPPPFQEICENREKQALGDALGLTQFGVNLVRLAPGAASAQRHWHTREDEFVYVLDGELALLTDAGEQLLGAGTAAGFAGAKHDGHQLINRGSVTATYLEVGSRIPGEEVHYPDIDLHLVRKAEGGHYFQHKNGEAY